MCLGIYVRCVLVVLCLSLGCVFCFLWCVACCWMCFVSMSCVLVSCVAGLVWGCVSACGVLVVGLFGVVCLLGVLCMCLCCLLYGVCFMCVLLYWVCCVLYVWCGVSIGLLFWCFGCVVVVGFGVWAYVVFCFWVLAWFCFLVGCWGFVFCWAVVCWFGWWFVFVGCLGGFCALGVGGCVLFFGAILFVLIVVGLSGFLLASAFCLVLQPVF